MVSRARRQGLTLMAVLGLAVLGCAQGSADTTKPAQAATESPTAVPEAIKVVRPEKPLKVKIKKTAKGKIVWEVDGRDLDKAIEAAKKLQRTFPK